MPRPAAILLLTLMLAASTGCELMGVVAKSLEDRSKPPVFTLPVKPTLIIVEDPGGYLLDSQLPLAAAARASAELAAAQVVSSVVDPKAVVDLARERGPQFASMPVDRVGKAVGAEQVVHVHVQSSSVGSEPGVMRPAAVVLVRVIDVVGRSRIFPPSAARAAEPDRQGTVGAYALTVSLRLRVSATEPGRAMETLRRALADRIGLEVARLFFKHEPEPEDIRSVN